MPARSVETIASSSERSPALEAFTCGSCDRLVLRSTRPISGSATRKPLSSTTYAFPLLADLDPRDDVPDELQVDVGDRHGSVLASRTNRDGHVRFGLFAEVHGPEPRLPSFRVAERRFLRTILAGSHVVHAEARHCDLLAAGGIQLRNVRDLRRLAQELEELDPAQFGVARIQLRQRGVLELLFDPANVLLDSRCRRERLLVLQAGQRGLVFLVGEVDADPA